MTVVQNCPVARADPPCPETPVAARLSVSRSAGDTLVATIESGADGRFVVQLPPGGYLLRPLTVIGGTSRESRPVVVTVQSGQYTTVTVLFDTGIR